MGAIDVGTQLDEDTLRAFGKLPGAADAPPSTPAADSGLDAETLRAFGQPVPAGVPEQSVSPEKPSWIGEKLRAIQLPTLQDAGNAVAKGITAIRPTPMNAHPADGEEPPSMARGVFSDPIHEAAAERALDFGRGAYNLASWPVRAAAAAVGATVHAIKTGQVQDYPEALAFMTEHFSAPYQGTADLPLDEGVRAGQLPEWIIGKTFEKAAELIHHAANDQFERGLATPAGATLMEVLGNGLAFAAPGAVMGMRGRAKAIETRPVPEPPLARPAETAPARAIQPPGAVEPAPPTEPTPAPAVVPPGPTEAAPVAEKPVAATVAAPEPEVAAAPPIPTPAAVESPPIPARAPRVTTQAGPPITDTALVADLQRFAGEAGWATRGGQLLRDGEGASADEIAAGMTQQVGNVIGRTEWIPKQSWFQVMRQELKSAGLTGEGEIRRAVDKYIAGEPLKAKERRTVEWIVDEIAKERKEFDELEAQARAESEAVGVPYDALTPPDSLVGAQIPKTPQNLSRADLVTKAGAIDSQFVEDAWAGAESDEAFYQRLAEFVKEHEDGKNRAGQQGEGAGAQAGEAPGNAEVGAAVQAVEPGSEGANRVEGRAAGENLGAQGEGAQDRARVGRETVQDLTLTGQTEAQIRADALKAEQAKTRAKQAENAPNPADFTLTGSDRARDVGAAAGQQELAAATPAVGEYVLFTTPGVDGPIKLRGRVVKYLDDGRAEVKVAERGYYKLKPEEMQNATTSRQSEPQAELQGAGSREDLRTRAGDEGQGRGGQAASGDRAGERAGAPGAQGSAEEPGRPSLAGERKNGAGPGARSALGEQPVEGTEVAREAARARVDTEPTEAQIEAGNYQKGHLSVQGLDVTIENPKGSTRTGTNAAGKKWETTLAHDYGYVKGTLGKDGDHVDVFLGPNLKADRVYVIDQAKGNGQFDEHKAMVGFDSPEAAKKGYLANYEPGWDRIKDVTDLSMDQFKDWLKNGDTKRPAAETAVPFKASGWEEAEGGRGVPFDEAVRAVEPLTQRFGKHINVVERFSELPANILETAKKRLAPGHEQRVAGAFDPATKRMYVVAENAASPDGIVRTVLHEAVGHYGVRTLLGDRLDPVMRQIYSSKAGDIGRALAPGGKMENYRIDVKTDGGKIRAAEEFVARLAETDPTNSLVQRVIAAIRNGLREIGVKVKMSDADIIDLIRRSRDALAKEGEAGRGEAAFHTAWHGSPYDFEHPSNEAIGSGEGAQAYGWGHYFAGKKAVADWYRKKLTGGARPEINDLKATKDGKPLNGWNLLPEYFKPGRIVRSYGGWDEVISFNGDPLGRWDVTVKEVKDQFGKKPDSYSDRPRTHATTPESKEVIEALQKDGWKFKDQGQLYKAELAPKEREYLDWDKPLSEQSEEVKTSLKGTQFMNSASTKGSTLYDNIALTLAEEKGGGLGRDGDQKAASEYLASVGIPGIKYLEGASRVKGEGNYNYVIFDPKSVEKFEPQFQTREDQPPEGFNAVKIADLGYAVTGHGLSGEGPTLQRAASDVAQQLRTDKKPELAKQLTDWAETNPNVRERADPTFQTREPDRGGEDVGPAKEKQKGIYSRAAGTIVDRIDQAFNPLGKLPEQDTYLAQRGIAQGVIEKVNDYAKSISKMFSGASDADKKAIFDYLTTKDADTKAIVNPLLRKEAADTKVMINLAGDEMVKRGMLSEESRDQYKDAYLPRLYLKHLLNEADWKALGTGRKPSDMGYLKKRKDIPEDVRRVLLGEIQDPGYLAAVAIAKPARDMALLDWLKKISEKKEWALPGSTIDYVSGITGKRTRSTPFWLKDEAIQLRRQSEYYAPEDAAKALAEAQRMDVAADKAIGTIEGEHNDFKQIPNTARYGKLRGMYVREEIYNDLMGVSDFMPTDPSWFQNIFGYGGVGTKATQVWKTMKVALNPPGQVRNFISNGVMMQLGGVPLHMVPVRWMQAANEIVSGGKHYEIGKKYGVGVSTFSVQELGRLKTALLDLEAKEKTSGVLGRMHNIGSTIMNKAGDLYQFSETLGKTGMIIDGMERQGMTETQAVAYAQKWLFDYSLVGKSVRYARSAPIGVPFVTYQVKVLPRLAEVALQHPQRLLPWIGLFYGFPAMTAYLNDVTTDELDRLKKAMPEWIQDKGHALIMPWKDGQGRWQVADLGYFMPWTNWTELGGDLASGQLGKAVKAAGIFSGPLTDIITAIKTGKDPFTGRDIYAPGDPPAKQAVAIVNYMWNVAAPPVLTDRGIISPVGALDKEYGGKAVQAATGTTNKYGEPRATGTQAAMAAFGLNTYGLTPEITRMQNIQRMEFEIKEVQTRMIQKLGDQSLSPEQKSGIVDKYQEEIVRRNDKLTKYVNESFVDPRLATR